MNGNAVAPMAAIEIEGLSFAHPGREEGLADVDLTVNRGEVACLLGPNGAGKTTLLRCLLGLLRPDRGVTRICGQKLSTLTARERARLVAYVPQSTATVFPFTTLDMAVMGRTPHLPVTATPSRRDRVAALAVLADLGLDHLAEQSFASLSGGERTLALVARALVQEADVLVLDEPTAALDLGNAVQVLGVIRGLADRGRAVLMTTHQPDHALHAGHRAVLMANGRVIADGDPRRELTGPVLSRVYGTPIVVAAATAPQLDQPVLTCVPSELVSATGTRNHSRPTPTVSASAEKGARP